MHGNDGITKLLRHQQLKCTQKKYPTHFIFCNHWANVVYEPSFRLSAFSGVIVGVVRSSCRWRAGLYWARGAGLGPTRPQDAPGAL